MTSAGRRWNRLWPALALGAATVACTYDPVRNLEVESAALGLTRIEVPGTLFRHVVLQKADASLSEQLLHVYIDGDGTPWLGPGRPAADPTPRNPLVLRLMALDPSPAVYLGRPCYLGQGGEGACHPWHWTHGRYSETVVASMAAALVRVRARYGNPELVLIGYSGGGTIAMLLAARVPGVRQLVTLAGNLDPEQWARRHGYSLLETSLNPSRNEPLPPAIRQIHIVGAQDRNLPPESLRAALAAQPDPELWVLPDADHRCCWEALWPELLARIGEAPKSAEKPP